MEAAANPADKVGDFPLGPRAISLAELQRAVGTEIHLSDEDLAGDEDQWKLCVIGKLLGTQLDASFVHHLPVSRIDVMKIGCFSEKIFQHGRKSKGGQ